MYELEDRRIAMDHPDLFARGGARVHGGHRPAYGDAEVAGEETQSGDWWEDTDLEAARRELTSVNPLLDATDAEAIVLSLTGGEKDEASQARALAWLAQQSPSLLQRLAVELNAGCSCNWCTSSTMIGLAALSEADRKKASAHTIPGTTDFPIPDAHHLGLAKGRYHAGQLAGHSKATVAAHINAAAKRLGLPGLDAELHQLQDHPEGVRPDKRVIHKKKRIHEGNPSGSAEDAFSSGPGSDSAGGPGADLAASVPGYDERFMRLAAEAEDGDEESRLILLAAQVNRTAGAFNGNAGYGRPGGNISAPPFKVNEVSRDDTERVDVDSVIGQLSRDHPSFFAEKPHGSVTSSPPRSAATRRRAEERELSGGRRQAY